ncbi:MAG: flagellar assembly protein FliH [Spirochaetales bacterium]|nr:flagellar assembly protein FliH [Spirochaetales bacterium]
MAKNVFRPTEVVNVNKKVFIDPPKVMEKEEPKIEERTTMEEYTGPSLDDLRKEAEEFKSRWEEERSQKIKDAEAEAERIIKDAEAVAFDEVKKKNNQAQKIKQEAEAEAKQKIEEAKKQAEELEAEVKQKVERIENQAYEKGYRDGHEQGFNGGKDEVQRLIDRLHVIMTKAIDKRNEIIEESETQIINLVLLIAKKVIKVISENQKNVVINNVIQALRKLKSRGDVVIRVNLSDLDLTTEHIKDFMSMVENVKSITVLEDSSVDKGGCIIETDFGQIDARISSQLHEIEENIIELMPIRAKGEQ